MKMKTPGLLALFLATCFTYTVEGQRHRIKSMQCDMKLLFTMNTQCTCCAAAFKMACPKGWIKTTQGLGERGCSYTVKLGGNTLSLPGCSHACKKEVEKKNCCQGFWGTECYECPSFSDKPCSGHGTCLDGITQNGTCICEVSMDFII
uniref:Uncharacterized protein n=1 Tax=Sphenodon punctatus TaxID=8508 RepID=A0A8D0GGW7_SPHPU